MYLCKVYKLCNSNDDEIYIGSTKQKLGQRFSEHKSRAKKGKKNMLIYDHMRKLGIDKFYIELLEEKEVANKQEQMKLEVLWQEKEACKLNKYRAQSTIEKRKELDKEYRQKSEVKVKLRANSYKYKLNNRDKINEGAAIYRENNHDKAIESTKRWRAENKDKELEYRQRPEVKAKLRANARRYREKKRLQRANSE